MMIEVKEVDPYEIDWDSQVKSIPEGTIFQTTYWARYLGRRAKAKSLFLIAQGEKGDILGSLLLYRTHYFKRLLKFGILGNLIFRVINQLIPAATWNFGPLIYDKSNFDEVFKSLLRNAIKIARKKGIVFLKDVTVPIHSDEAYLIKAHNILRSLYFKQKGFATILIDLQKDEHELWVSLRNSARKVIKKSDTLGLNILSMTKEYLDDYYRLLAESRKRSGVELPPHYPNKEMWEELGGEKKILELFSVNKEGKLLGAIGILNFNGIIFETGPAQSDYAFENKIYASDILKWHIIKNSKSWGARLYDLCGIFFNPKDGKEKSLNQFKEKWGGRVVSFSLYSKLL
ncbi:MAG: hypothetical protein ISS47_07830 [Candidatus Omnitrophica bacterium]|nr:hypothetical protein [Candidatus Omnitrophota bacterium]